MSMLTSTNRKELHGRAMFETGMPGTHLHRFHKDPAEHLAAYGVFHGDSRQPEGEPLPTGSLRRFGGGLGSTQGSGSGSNAGTGVYHAFGGGPPAAYTIRPTMSLGSLLKDRDTARSADGQLLGTMRSQSTGQPLSATGTAYHYSTGTYISASGLPPTQYKSWMSEYIDEYRGPKVRKDNLNELTMRHGTLDALRTSRYQFQGYPQNASNPAFRKSLESSLTNRGQVMPNFESRVRAF